MIPIIPAGSVLIPECDLTFSPGSFAATHVMTTPRLELVQPDAVSRQFLERFDFDHNDTPMWVFDLRNFAFLHVNQAAVQSYGYSRADFLAMTILDIRPVEHVVLLLREELLEHQHNSTREPWVHRRKNGSLFKVEITSHEMTFNGHPAELVLARYVAELK